MTTRRLLALCAASLAALTSCSSAGSQGGVFMDTSKIPSALQADYDSFAVNCSKCHSLSRALNAPVTDPKHWDLYVARMMRTAGSAISPSEEPKILRFLHWYTVGYKGAERKSDEAEAVKEAEALGVPAPEPAYTPNVVEPAVAPSAPPPVESVPSAQPSVGESK